MQLTKGTSCSNCCLQLTCFDHLWGWWRRGGEGEFRWKLPASYSVPCPRPLIQCLKGKDENAQTCCLKYEVWRIRQTVKQEDELLLAIIHQNGLSASVFHTVNQRGWLELTSRLYSWHASLDVRLWLNQLLQIPISPLVWHDVTQRCTPFCPWSIQNWQLCGSTLKQCIQSISCWSDDRADYY